MRSKPIVSVLVSIATAPFYANADSAPSPSTMPTQAQAQPFDTQSLFETSGSPLQLAALSAQEMKETEGAWSARATIERYFYGYRQGRRRCSLAQKNLASTIARAAPVQHYPAVFARGFVDDVKGDVGHRFATFDGNKLVLVPGASFSHILADGVFHRTGK